MNGGTKVAAAPISWGVSELREWGHQMPAGRVLGEMSGLGFAATEAGPPGYLPDDPADRKALLEQHHLRLAAGFLATVLHNSDSGGLAEVESAGRWLAASGADVLVLAAAMPGADYEGRRGLSDEDWRNLRLSLAAAERVGETYGLTVTLHPHIGTAVQSKGDVEKLLSTTDADLCLDTGHLFLGGADPVEVVASAPHRIKHVHLKDVDRHVGTAFRAGQLSFGEAVRRGVFKPLGQGDLDLAAVVDPLRGAGYTGWFVLEQDTALTAEPDPGAGPVVSAGQSLAYFRRISGVIVG